LLSSNCASLARLKEISAAHADLTPYLTREMLLRARSFMSGVSLYREHSVRRGPETAPVIWRSGSTCLRDYAPDAVDAVPVLIVPSLINRFSILDLEPGHSFVRYLAAQGFRPLVVDWDTPSEAEKDFGLGSYVMERVVPALKIASASQPAHLVGYCMGGALTLAAASLYPQRVRSLVLLATPWDFHAGYEAMGQNGAMLEEKLGVWLDGNDYLPVEVVQSVFTAFQPLHAFRKFSAFAGYNQAGPQAARFVLTEDWLNDGVPLTAKTARECFGDWCARNALARCAWRIGGQGVDPCTVLVPSYVVVPGKDRIVPPQSAMPLAQALPHAVRHEPMMGHIGIMSSPSAVSQVWKPLAGWLSVH
ncbi:MAG: alpha/beta fold hydrolase, partial [Alphaproteobacteria bacterium]|nr:alpha/beta fold hydrolase [Alphaproteobacteria bacterium]